MVDTNNPLFTQLMQRQLQTPGSSQPPPPMATTPAPMPVLPPSDATKVPPQMQRWMNGQQVQDAYANNWQPNPILLRAQLGK